MNLSVEKGLSQRRNLAEPLQTLVLPRVSSLTGRGFDSFRVETGGRGSVPKTLKKPDIHGPTVGDVGRAGVV